MRSNAFLSACLALGLVVLTISFFATKTSASPTNTQTMDIDEYNPFTSSMSTSTTFAYDPDATQTSGQDIQETSPQTLGSFKISSMECEPAGISKPLEPYPQIMKKISKIQSQS